MFSSKAGVQYSSHEIAMDDFLDTTLLTNEDIAAILSSTNSSMLMDNNGGLDRNNGLEKPVRKRSRASKHTPSTFLIAKASDFRALVQQLTGCQSADSYKGPINLNFGAAEDETTDIDKVSTIPMLEFNFYNHKTHQVKNHQDHQLQQHHHHQQQQHDLEHDQRLSEEQESSSNGGNTFVSAYSSPGHYSMTRDDLSLEDIFMNDSFDYGEYSSNGIVADQIANNVDGDYSSDYSFPDDTILFSGY